MDYYLGGLITGIAIHPKKHKLLAVGVDETIHYVEHKETALRSTRSIKLNDFGVDFIFNQDGSQLNAISRDKEIRIFDAELNLKRRFKFGDDTGSTLARPIPRGPEGHLGIDVIVGFDSGKIKCYDTRQNTKIPAIKLETHSNIVKRISCLDWWNCLSVAEDGFIVLNDLRAAKKKREFGVLDGLIQDFAVCPISKKSVVCTTTNVYVFDLYKCDEGPLLKANAPLKGRTPIGVLNLSTEEYPDLFGVSYLDTSYITLLDTDKNKWLCRHPIGFSDVETFTRLEHKSNGYVYFTADSEYFCVRKIEDIRTKYDIEYNFKAKSKREDSKKPVSSIDFSGLVEKNSSEADDVDEEVEEMEDIYGAEDEDGDIEGMDVDDD
uniref:Ribosome biogenesis protein NSA1 n=1 Tax=Panagrolaimus sp. ES5 TaxID=591445 RepID=A0AC34F019_9BILA